MTDGNKHVDARIASILAVFAPLAVMPRRIPCFDLRPDHVRASDERATEQTGTERMESKRRGN